MHTRVDLQGMLSYEMRWVIATVITLLLLALAWFITKKLKTRKPRVKKPPKVSLASLRTQALSDLEKLGADFREGKKDTRESYQALSIVVRTFVQGATGINVQNYTLSDIKKVNMPDLYILISECYDPEFKEHDEESDFLATLEKAKEVVTRWA